MNTAPDPLASRRPLKSRSTPWAAALARTLLRAGFKPNHISLLSVIFAAGSGACLLSMAYGLPPVLGWFGAAAGIQLRLLCNLMDGMLAVEGGLRSPDGDLWNEIPDRFADAIILAALGQAGGSFVSGILGWIAACGALCTACVRMQGASLTGRHDFRGPMAKPHRMALATVTCLIMIPVHFLENPPPVVTTALVVMDAGIALTLIRRIRALSLALREGTGQPTPPS